MPCGCFQECCLLVVDVGFFVLVLFLCKTMKCRLRVAANELDSSFRFNYVGKKKQIKWYDIKGAKRLESLHNFVSNQSFGNVLGWSERARIKLTWGVINLYQSISETAATTVSRDLSFYVKQKKINSNNKWWIAKFLHYFFQLPKVVLSITFANFQLSVGWQFFSFNPLISVAGKEVICDISYEGFLIEYGFWWFLMIVDLLPSKNKLFHHILQWISK